MTQYNSYLNYIDENIVSIVRRQMIMNNTQYLIRYEKKFLIVLNLVFSIIL